EAPVDRHPGVQQGHGGQSAGGQIAISRRVWHAMLVVACVIAAGCPGGCDPTKLLDVTGVQSVSIAPATVQLTVGQTQQYTATVKPDRFSDDGVTWSVTPSSMA